MKVKIFEEYNNDYLAFNDEYMAIHKILNGPNKGKIRFIFHENESKYSMMYGCTLILGTKYEKIPEIRQITLEDKFRKIASNSMESIFGIFIERVGFEEIDFTELERKILNNLVKKFGNEMEQIITESGNIGDVLDGLKSVQSEVFEYLKDDYGEWKFNKDVTKYNL